MKNELCDEVLENIKNSLMVCKNNKMIYLSQQPININSCENIIQFQKSLHATKTKIEVNTFTKVSQYSIEYNVQDRVIELKDN